MRVTKFPKEKSACHPSSEVHFAGQCRGYPLIFFSPAFEEHKKVVVVKLSYRQSFTLAIESVPFNVSQDLFSNSISSPQMILMPYQSRHESHKSRERGAITPEPGGCC